MLILNVSILIILVKLINCKTLLKNFPIVDLLENSPINTLVISLSQIKNSTNLTKSFVLLNVNGFESNLFSIENENVYTKNVIDREEFINKSYCLNEFYCKIELHIIVNNGNEYWIIPIHIVDVNDNEPTFREKEIKLRFRENVLNGYQIPFEGAKDLDEGKNNEIEYILDCSNDSNLNLNKTIKSCFSLFELIIISQSFSSLKYDQLALKFVPLLTNLENQYELKLYAINKNQRKKNSLKIQIEIEEKEKLVKFSLSKYEFVILLNSSFLTNKKAIEIPFGRVYAIPKNSFERIFYKLINQTQNQIKINSLTGELNFLFNSNLFYPNEIEFDVEASILKRNSSKLLIRKSQVKLFIRYFNYLNQILFQFKINSSQTNQILQISNSNSFFIHQNIKTNSNLFQIFVYSSFYPFDKFILSLENYFHFFSLISSSELNNTFILKTKQFLHFNSTFILNISVKHKLTQEYVPNLIIKLIVIDQLTISTTTRISTTTSISTRTRFEMRNVFCQENEIYILYQINEKKKKKKKMNLLKVIKSNLIRKEEINFFGLINKSEIIINNRCRMSFQDLNKISLLNNNKKNSFEYELCLLSNNSNQCFNLTFVNQLNSNDKSFLSIKIVEFIILIFSLIFICIILILIFLIFRLKQINLCFKLKNCFIYKNKFSSSKIKEKVHSIVNNEESRSPSFQSIQIKNDRFIYNFDPDERFSSPDMFVLSSLSIRPSSFTYSFEQQEQEEKNIVQSTAEDLATIIPQRTSSSSSFLKETKQLLDMISNNQQLDLSKLVSEV